MDTITDDGKSDAFDGFVLLMRIFWGPMFWPLIIANAIGYGWCAYQGRPEHLAEKAYSYGSGDRTILRFAGPYGRCSSRSPERGE